MGWFKKNKEISEERIPSLPELPELPEFQKRDISQLPSFPNSSFGEKFSQNSIKEAVAGKEEDYWKGVDASEEEQMMPKPPSPKKRKEFIQREISSEFKEAVRRAKESEPLFIRIDRFEECIKIFNNIKEKMGEIEKMLNNTKKIKEEEEEELRGWENKIKTTKEQIEKIDKEIFSKLE